MTGPASFVYFHFVIKLLEHYILYAVIPMVISSLIKFGIADHAQQCKIFLFCSKILQIIYVIMTRILLGWNENRKKI